MVSIAKSTRGILLAAVALSACHRLPSTEQQSAMGAVDEMQKLGAAEEAYHEAHGHFAKSMDELTMHVWVRGYTITLAGNGDGFTIHADPIEFGKTGDRSFFTDQTHVIRYNDAYSAATASSPAIK